MAVNNETEDLQNQQPWFYAVSPRPDVYRVALTACLLLLLAGGTAHILFGRSDDECQALGYDDAYISYRYAHNLFRGNGLVFNPGERVEGYSNFSYTLLVSLAFLFTHDVGVYYFSAFLNLLLAGAALVVFAAFVRKRLGNGLAIAGALLFAACLPVWAAVGSGLETCLVLLIYISIYVVTETLAQGEDRQQLVALCALSTLSLLSRADGFLMPGAAIVYLLLKRRNRAALACAITLGASGLIYEVWRYHYYGALLPNTYYIRVTGSLAWRAWPALRQLGWITLHEGLFPYLLVFLLLSLELAGRWWRNRRLDPALLGFDLFLGACWIAYWFFIGGDYVGERFLLILFPLGIFGLLKIAGTDAKPRAIILVVGLAMLAEILPPRLTDSRFQLTRHRYDCWLATGEFLRIHYPGKSIAVSALGKIPFLLDSSTVDMHGLIDPVIAHAPAASREFNPGHVKFNTERTLSKRPDLLVGSIDPDTLDMLPDLGRPKYEGAGYHLRDLVYAGFRPPREAILSTRDMPEEAIHHLMEKGYTWAILSRE